MKAISKLQYITQDVPGKKHWQLAEEACAAGVKWIQLRVKNKNHEDVKSITLKTLEVCRQYGSTLILNDYVALAHECKTDGVHLGKTDMDIMQARNILGDDMIIGGTANTLEDLLYLTTNGANYIGLGPFRFTTTKEKLSPILGLEGYHAIMEKYHTEKTTIPIIAIGGVVQGDVRDILSLNIDGVAVASAIGLSVDKKKIVDEFSELLNQKQNEFTTW